jgi:hypothetical protein
MSETETAGAVPAVKKNKGGRPRKVAAPVASGPSFSDEQFQQLIGVLAANKSESGSGIDLAALKVLLEGTALATQKAMKPENQVHPGISALSYPEGDRDRPRPSLPYEFFWNGYPVHKFPETQHWRELELMAQVTPGEYTIMRKDFTPMAVTVDAERDANGAITKLRVDFPISREERGLVPPQIVLLYQLVHSDNPKRRFVEAMQQYLLMMVGETEDVTALAAV